MEEEEETIEVEKKEESFLDIDQFDLTTSHSAKFWSFRLWERQMMTAGSYYDNPTLNSSFYLRQTLMT